MTKAIIDLLATAGIITQDKIPTATSIVAAFFNEPKRADYDPEKTWVDFWTSIVCDEHGNVVIEQVKKELADFSFIMDQVPKVYMHITGARMSKIMYPASAVISEADAHYESLADQKLKPHPDYEFEEDDKVFVENSDDTVDYFLVHYEPEMAEWVLIPFTDKTFTQTKANAEGRVVAESLSAYGYDLLQRCEEFEFDELA